MNSNEKNADVFLSHLVWQGNSRRENMRVKGVNRFLGLEKNTDWCGKASDDLWNAFFQFQRLKLILSVRGVGGKFVLAARLFKNYTFWSCSKFSFHPAGGQFLTERPLHLSQRSFAIMRGH